MAASVLVLSNPLCFLSQRYGKSAAKVLKSTVLDFYSASDLVAAKNQLTKNVSDVKTFIQIPHVPVRRDNEHQATRVVDDSFYRATACNATHGIAVAILSVRPSVCLSVRLSVRCVYCDKTKQRTANILIPHETAITLVF